MLTKRNRATTKDVQHAVVVGKTHHTPFFSLRVARTTEEFPKVAVVVSKKAAPRAVDRNRIKRRVRHALRGISLSPRSTYIVYVKKEALPLSHTQLNNALDTLFS